MHSTLSIQNWQSSPASQQITKNLFQRSGNLKAREFTYKTHNDFGKIISDLLVSKPKEHCSANLVANLKEIGKIEGFKVTASQIPFYPVRDAKCKAADGSWIESSNSTDSLNKALERIANSYEQAKRHARVLTMHPSLDAMIGQVARHHMHNRTFDGIAPDEKDDKSKYQDGRIF